MSSVRTRASWTGVILPLEPRATLKAIRRITRPAPSPIYSHFFFIGEVLLPEGSFPAAAHLVDLRFSDLDVGQRRNAITPSALQLDLGVDQLEDGSRANVVLLLGELLVFCRRLDRALRDIQSLQRLAVGEQGAVDLARQ